MKKTVKDIPDDMILQAFQYLDEYLSSKIEVY